MKHALGTLPWTPESFRLDLQFYLRREALAGGIACCGTLEDSAFNLSRESPILFLARSLTFSPQGDERIEARTRA